MNGTKPGEGQKPPLSSEASSNGSTSLVAKKRKKDVKPIITTDAGADAGYEYESLLSFVLVLRFFCVLPCLVPTLRPLVVALVVVIVIVVQPLATRETKKWAEQPSCPVAAEKAVHSWVYRPCTGDCHGSGGTAVHGLVPPPPPEAAASLRRYLDHRQVYLLPRL
ncbi:hypothetical protein GQ602_002923 [Ophiocordyceps camponoti-floridani]|uniref:Uncharacterized protein n=1 Tax=Ophiocordyceps camponoti-floridani TaxID=2030778 RepID=A0A8H4VDQ9_9HYPO|nr:hypothetical protein GQ602_002923 [Ophiocordyceps camponoti-floridani]